MVIAKIAFRNIFRHKRRSLLTGMMMAGGGFLFSVFIGMVDGTYGNIIDMFTRDHTGHIQVHKGGYLEKPSIYESFPDPGAIGRKIKGIPYVESWAPRVHTPALAFAGAKTTGVRVIGLEPKREAATTRIREKVSEGRFISGQPEYEAIISSGLSRILKVGVGDEIAMIAQGVDGSLANDLFTVVGIADEGEVSYSGSNCYIHIAKAQEFLAMGDRVHELAVVLKEHTMSRQVARSIEEELSDASLDVSPWQVVEEQFYRAMRADIKGNWISIFVLTVVIAVGVLNTVLMVVLERTREYGVLRAIGTRPLSVFKLIVLETAFLSVMSITLGTAAGMIANHLLSIYGIAYPEPIEYGGVMFKELTARITARSIVLPATIVFLTALLVSVFPAIRAARIIPVKALRD
jgi:ABC-type lipoprotein release transport system permease subunit